MLTLIDRLTLPLEGMILLHTYYINVEHGHADHLHLRCLMLIICFCAKWHDFELSLFLLRVWMGGPANQ